MEELFFALRLPPQHRKRGIINEELEKLVLKD